MRRIALVTIYERYVPFVGNFAEIKVHNRAFGDSWLAQPGHKGQDAV
jgi:hypothetical protein